MTDAIVDRVRKLLELSKSDNVNESANAAKLAQKLMTEHTITEAMIAVKSADGETEESIEEGALHKHSTNSMPTWKMNLGGSVSRANQCRILIGDNYLTIVGRPSDAAKSRFLFSHVADEIDRLAKQERVELGAPGRTYLNNFRLGAVDAVTGRLYEAEKEARAEAMQKAQSEDTMGTGSPLAIVSKALARIDQRRDESDAYVKANSGGTRQTGSSAFDGAARAAGRRAGKEIDLGGQREALGPGQRRRLM